MALCFDVIAAFKASLWVYCNKDFLLTHGSLQSLVCPEHCQTIGNHLFYSDLISFSVSFSSPGKCVVRLFLLCCPQLALWTVRQRIHFYFFLSASTSAVNKLPMPSLRGPSVFLADLLDYMFLKNVFLFIFIILCNLPFILHLCFSYHFFTLSTSSCNLSIPLCIWYYIPRTPPLIILHILVQTNWPF